jgi:hypothetical protein
MNEVILVIEQDGAKRAMRLPFKVEVGEGLLSPLKSLLSEQAVVVR